MGGQLRNAALTTAGVVALVVAGGAHASGIGGDAGGYNIFIFGSGNFIATNADSTGDIAAGGNVMLSSYQVAGSVSGNTALVPNPARLVVGGTLTASNGEVGSGGSGTIYTNNTPTLSSFTAAAVAGQTVISSFSADETEYQNLSTFLGGLSQNGSVSTGAGNALNLTGTSGTLNIFDISGSQITGASGGTINISAPAGSTVLINVSGSSATFANGSVNETNVGAATVLYNFVSATSVTLSSMDPEGSILAPDAGVVGSNGQMHGQLIAASYGMGGEDSTQFDDVMFTGTLPAAVPLPAPVWLLLSGLALIMSPTLMQRSRARLLLRAG